MNSHDGVHFSSLLMVSSVLQNAAIIMSKIVTDDSNGNVMLRKRPTLVSVTTDHEQFQRTVSYRFLIYTPISIYRYDRVLIAAPIHFGTWLIRQCPSASGKIRRRTHPLQLQGSLGSQVNTCTIFAI
jgi:hypothetical protein